MTEGQPLKYRYESYINCASCGHALLLLNRYGMCAKCTAGMADKQMAKLDGVMVVPVTKYVPTPSLATVATVSVMLGTAAATAVSWLWRYLGW